MRVSPVVLVVALALSAALAGCISGAFSPAKLGSDPPAGWQYDSQNSQGGQSGNALATVRYQLNVYDTTDSSKPPGALGVVSVSSVPLIDVQGQIKQKLDDWVSQQGISLSQTGTGATTIQGNRADYTLFDATKTQNGATVHGRAIDLKYTCSANGEAVRLFGFAATEMPGFLGGSQKDTASWTTVVGQDPPASPAGGMLGQVVCS